MATNTRTHAPRRRKAASASAGERRRHITSTKRDRAHHDDGKVRQQQRGAGTQNRGLLSAWHAAQERVRAQVWFIEAESMLASAQRLARDQYYVAAETQLTSVLRLLQEAAALLPADDTRPAALAEKIQRATQEIRAEGRAAAARLEQVVKVNERLLRAFAQ